MTVEQFEDAASQLVLGILPEAELAEFQTYLETATTEEILIFRNLRMTSFQLNNAAEQHSPSSDLKAKILSNIPTEKKATGSIANPIVMPLFRYAASLIAMFAIGMLFSSAFNSKTLASNEKLSSTERAVFAHEKEITTIAMCSHVTEKVLNAASKQAAAGKVYLNKVHHAMVIHVCLLPKLAKNEHYVVWCTENGQSHPIQSLYAENADLREQNFSIENLNSLSADMSFEVTVEKANSPVKPSTKVLLRS